ncbi:hypothetical protein [Glutamicibacter endophyticus]|uniref:hypothetical protein n=1 Tax=Glutamicibacter endophyticus TaxID=1522174 RepID=UPI003AF0987B
MRKKLTTALVIGLLLIPVTFLVGSQLLLVSDQNPVVPQSPVIVENTPRPSVHPSQSSTGQHEISDGRASDPVTARESAKPSEPAKEQSRTPAGGISPIPQPSKTPTHKPAPKPVESADEDDEDEDDDDD